MISDRDKIAFDETVEYTKDNRYIYGLRFFKNWVLERLASNFPVPSWWVMFHRMRGIHVGKNGYIGYDVIFDRIHPDCITIGDYAEIGDRRIICDYSRGFLPLRDKYPKERPASHDRERCLDGVGCIVIQDPVIGEWAAGCVKDLVVNAGKRVLVGVR